MTTLVTLDSLFSSAYGTRLDLIDLEECSSQEQGALPYVGRTGENNGVTSFVKKIPTHSPCRKNTISLALGGTVLSAFYQPFDYYSGEHIAVLTPKRLMKSVELILYAKIIQMNAYKYNYGRQANLTYRNLLIPQKIPKDFLGVLTKQYSKFLKQISESSINKSKKIQLHPETWCSYALTDLFNISGSRTTPPSKIQELSKGDYPYVTTSAVNNGVNGFYDCYTEKGGVLTVDSAVNGYCAYQARNFLASDHVEVLTPNSFTMNSYRGLFLSMLMNRERYRYNYGRKASQTRLGTCRLRLPAKDNGTPNWSLIDQYMKSLPYSSNLHE